MVLPCLLFDRPWNITHYARLFYPVEYGPRMVHDEFPDCTPESFQKRFDPRPEPEQQIGTKI